MYWLVKLQRLDVVSNRVVTPNFNLQDLATCTIEELKAILNNLWDEVAHEETDLEYKFKFNK